MPKLLTDNWHLYTPIQTLSVRVYGIERLKSYRSFVKYVVLQGVKR